LLANSGAGVYAIGQKGYSEMNDKTALMGGFWVVNFLARTEKGDKEKRQH
jgi:hypothetical protein